MSHQSFKFQSLEFWHLFTFRFLRPFVFPTFECCIALSLFCLFSHFQFTLWVEKENAKMTVTDALTEKKEGRRLMPSCQKRSLFESSYEKSSREATDNKVTTRRGKRWSSIFFKATLRIWLGTLPPRPQNTPAKHFNFLPDRNEKTILFGGATQ